VSLLLVNFQSKGVSEMSKVYFMHVRNFTFDGRINNLGGSTIAYREVLDGIEFAESWCNSRDNFNKTYGRDKAQGRLNSDNYRRKFYGTFQEFHQAIDKGLI
jgi:hypothetical protein